MEERITRRIGRWKWAISLVVIGALALSWFLVAGPVKGRATAPLGPAEAPYYDPAPYTELAPGLKQFHLYATDGLHPLPDGGSLYIWGYSTENRPGTARLPGPTIVVDEGDQVEIVFTNLGTGHPDVRSMAHTIHLHGLDVPEWTDGVLKTVQPGDSFTYAFTATHAGTYWYHCHVDTIQHLTMGMYGSVVVRAKDGAAQAWTGGPAYDREYSLILSEADPAWHAAVEQGASFDRTNYNPRYFFINGRSFPDVLNEPADLIRGQKGETALVRLINTGYTWKSMHMHGFHFDVIASDGRRLPEPLSKDTLSVGPAERYDLLVNFNLAGTYPFHSHAIVDNLNSGSYPGGIHTMVQVDEPGAAAAGNEHAGHGAAPVLVDLSKLSYLKAGEVRAHRHGKPSLLTARPVVTDQVLLAPAQFVAAALGAEVTVEGVTSVLTFKRGSQRVRLTAQAAMAETERGELPLPRPIDKVGQSALVPVQFLADHFGVPLLYLPESGELLVGTNSVDATAAPLDPLTASRNLTRPPALPEQTAAPVRSGSAASPPAPTVPSVAPAATSIPAQSAAPTAGSTKTVVIHSRNFNPAEIQVKAGSTVVWLNADALAHAVTENDSRFDSGQVEAGRKWEHTFQQSGTFDYYCSIHPEMKGRIVVTD